MVSALVTWVMDYSMKGPTKIEIQGCTRVCLCSPWHCQCLRFCRRWRAACKHTQKASLSSLKMHLLIMFSFSMFHLNSSQMSITLANEQRHASGLMLSRSLDPPVPVRTVIPVTLVRNDGNNNHHWSVADLNALWKEAAFPNFSRHFCQKPPTQSTSLCHSKSRNVGQTNRRGSSNAIQYSDEGRARTDHVLCVTRRHG